MATPAAPPKCLMKYLPGGTPARSNAMDESGFLLSTTRLSLPFSSAANTPWVFGFGVAKLTGTLELPKNVPYL